MFWDKIWKSSRIDDFIVKSYWKCIDELTTLAPLTIVFARLIVSVSSLPFAWYYSRNTRNCIIASHVRCRISTSGLHCIAVRKDKFCGCACTIHNYVAEKNHPKLCVIAQKSIYLREYCSKTTNKFVQHPTAVILLIARLLRRYNVVRILGQWITN